ncbi:MAG: RraA family protein [Rhodospirillales bacterium]|jgi:4-hydroxy-4-methyl-2-oxoglutarate aldolase
MSKNPAIKKTANRSNLSSADKTLAAAIRKLKKMPTGYVYDALRMLGIGTVTDGVLPAGRKSSFVGPAVTLRWAPKRNAGIAPLNIYEFIRTCKSGQVLMMETGRADGWIMGENMSHHSMYQGLSAMVTDSKVRDFAEIAELKFPVFSTGPAIRRAEVELVGLNVPISCGGAQVVPGDIVIGDADGIAVVPAARIADVVYQAEAIGKVEAAQEKAIRDGVPMAKLKAIMAKKKVQHK